MASSDATAEMITPLIPIMYSYLCSALIRASAIASCLAFGAVSSATEPAVASLLDGRLFHLDFENGFAAMAEGNESPVSSANHPRLVEGIDGQAAVFDQGSVLPFSASDNLSKDKGTIAFWLQLPPADSAAGGGPWTLFAEEGSDDAGSTNLKIELFPKRLIRASIKDPRDTRLHYHRVGEWAAGEWHHVALTWNIHKGAFLYIDGQPVTQGWMPAWTPQESDRFMIGAGTADGEEAARVALDEFSIYGRELTEEEIRAAFQQHREFSAKVLIQDPFVSANEAAEVTVALINPGDRKRELRNLRYELVQGDDSVQGGSLPDQTLNPRGKRFLKVPLKAIPEGQYSLRVEYREDSQAREVRADVLAMGDEQVPEPRDAEMTLVDEVDAAEGEPIAESGGTTVVDAPFGAYREGGSSFQDRFAVAFEVEEADVPHVAVISYPDDKPRTMEIMLQDFSKTIDFQVHSGVYIGEEYPSSNGLLEHRVIFWPNAKQQAFIFMTMEEGYPAAVKGIKVYRLNEFAVAPRTGEFEGSVRARSSGLYWEDPVLFHNFGTGSDLKGFAQATDRLLDYMRSFGQTELEYPLVWYGGPLYGTAVEPFQPDVDGGQGGVRPHPPGYPLHLLHRLEQNGMKFTAGLHIHTLPSLNKYSITDWDRIARGEDTVINVNKNGRLWYGYWHGSDPNYNAADPRVMDAANAIVDEIVGRYGKEPAFDGVSLVIARPKLFSFGSIASGYNDSNLQRFQEASGITIPVYDIEDPQRFSKSYDWLMAHPEAKKAWVGWRCQVLARHYLDMADRIAAVRPDLKLKLNVFVHYTNNTRIAEYMTEPSGEAMREMGIDPDLLEHPNIVLDYTIIPADLRWGRAIQQIDNFRIGRTVITAPEVVASIRDFPNLRMTLHDRYWEDPIGGEEPLEGLKAIGVDEMVWRASTLNPSPAYALEPYVLSLQNLDVGSFMKGGYVIGTYAFEAELEAFSRAFQALPAVKFNDVATAVDPVRIRQKVVDGKLFFYALNTVPVPVDVTITFKESTAIAEPAAEKKWPSTRTLTLSLEPYGLRTFTAPESQGISTADATVPAQWLKDLEKRMEDVLTAAEKSDEAAEQYAPYLQLLRQSWSDGHYGRVYYLLQEHWASEVK